MITKKSGRPKSQKPRPVACTGLIPPHLADAVDRLAQTKSTSRSQIVKIAIETYLKNWPD